MKSNSEPIKNWFGYSRRERRSAFILLLIIILIIGLKNTVPERNIDIEDINASISGIESPDRFISGDMSSTGQPFSFDPNTASYDTLIKLGLASKQANILINYRNKGGKFRNPSDIKKVYGIEEEQAAKLIPFVKVATGTSGKVRTNYHQQQKPLLDINSCDSASLVSLPGIGPVLSARIIKYRHLLGGFALINQLKEVYGLPVETFDLIKGRIYADSSAILKININSADYKELSHLPYFEKYEVSAILKYRELKGSVTGITDLTENKLITEEKASKVRPYLRFE
ncbi:MAG: helix-hairpin-helix domain-containing protein [Bacteroidia bacterium]|nr:helix-hairpin-helix domain-containing protein [Bacteroidia bacterium]